MRLSAGGVLNLNDVQDIIENPESLNAPERGGCAEPDEFKSALFSKWAS